MFNKRIFSVVLGALLISVLSLFAAAQTPAPQTRIPRLARLKNYLALTDKQVSDIQDLFKRHQAEAFPIRQDLRARNQELRTVLEATEPNPASEGQLAIVRHSLKGQLRTLNMKLRDDIAAKLTPEQQHKFKELRMRGGKRGRHGQG